MSRERFCDTHWTKVPHGDEERADASGLDHVFAPEGETCSFCEGPASHSAFVPHLGDLVTTRTGNRDGRPTGGTQHIVVTIDRVAATLRLAPPEWRPGDPGDNFCAGPELPWTGLRDLA